MEGARCSSAVRAFTYDVMGAYKRPLAAITWAILFYLAARDLLYAPCHRQDSTYHDLCYFSHGALAGVRYSSMGPP